MNRSRQLLERLIAADKGMTVRELADAVDDGSVPIEKLRLRVSAQMSQMLVAGKVRRSGVLGNYRYRPTPTALVDRRLKPATAKSTARKRRLADKPRPLRASHTKVVLVNHSTRSTAPKVTARDQIASDVKAFLASGGKVQRLSPGECANPTKAWLAANGRAKPRKARTPSTTTTRDEDELDVATA